MSSSSADTNNTRGLNERPAPERCEWLEADGLGGFASGTVSGVRTRRYHALLLSASSPPAGRMALVNGVDAVVHAPDGSATPLIPHRYAGGWVTRAAEVESFTADPWPTWVYVLPDGTRIQQEVLAVHGSSRTLITWRRLGGPSTKLSVRPLMSGRDFHTLHRENGAFNFDPSVGRSTLTWAPYAGTPRVTIAHNGGYSQHPVWYRGFEYVEEVRRGFEAVEDLASPGVFEFDLRREGSGEASMILTAGEPPAAANANAAGAAQVLRERERARRAAFDSPLSRAADAYLVRRGEGKTIVAGYPWFGDWGRDTFIAVRGLCVATGRLDDARSILLEWARHVEGGLLPNRFPDRGERPEYNSVDAGLWFIVAAHELAAAAAGAGRPLPAGEQEVLRQATQAILCGCAKGTLHGVRLDEDGLLAAGEPGVQLTWMDARVGERVITPRIGKPVEVQALWLNALAIGAEWAPRWIGVLEAGLASFRARFWNGGAGGLFDVVDADHVPGRTDASVRPNQVFAVGGLPMGLLAPEQARAVVDLLESRLLTPMGLRSLDPGDPAYAGRYAGGPAERDAVYHQGTVWPWLLGPFVEAWVRVRGGTASARAEARARFLAPMLEHLGRDGLGHVSEVADGDAPHAAGGCPFQAWSLGELLRLDRQVLRVQPERAAPRRPARRRDVPGMVG